jgi:hypothetical protein
MMVFAGKRNKIALQKCIAGTKQKIRGKIN